MSNNDKYLTGLIAVVCVAGGFFVGVISNRASAQPVKFVPMSERAALCKQQDKNAIYRFSYKSESDFWEYCELDKDLFEEEGKE